MSSLARSFKPSSLLTPCRRPGMPGRTLSNSSERSLTSNHSARLDDMDDPSFSYSVPGTPSVIGTDEPSSAKKDGDRSDATVFTRSFHSRPIAIELPGIKRLNHTTIRTPPEPLSARGDLPGGYFPMHEDPTTRIHHPHPFYQDQRLARRHLAVDADAMRPDRTHSPTPSAPGTFSNMPAGTNIGESLHDTPLPTGKYYPSNYEKHHRQSPRHRQARPTISETLPSSMKSDSQVPRYAAESASVQSPDTDLHRRMQQYQRDVVAQAALALGGAQTQSVAASSSAPSMAGRPSRDIRFSSLNPRKPIAPRLLPIGSPGPVTPMELETPGGGYLDKGGSVPRRSKDGLVPPGVGYTAHSL